MDLSGEKAQNLLNNNMQSNENIVLPPKDDKCQTLDFGITIIIPVYNEEKRILRCLERMVQFINSRPWEYEIIIIEDGSSDGTVDIIRKFLSKNKQIKLITARERLGKGDAIKHGFSLAEKAYVGYLDADLSADPAEFERLLPFIDKYDIVIGSRILRGNLPPIKRPLSRSFLSRAYAMLFRLLFNVKIHDPQCGFKLFRSGAASNLFAQIETRGFAFDSELLVIASSLGMTIKEVPIMWKHDSSSKVCALHEIKTMGRDLMALWYRRNLNKRS